MDIRKIAAAAVLLIGCLIPGLAAPPAQGAEALGNLALDWAEAHATGCWYDYGGTDCAEGYDCSGLVMTAFEHVGIYLPHSTYAMLADSRLHWVPLSEARRGDLLFYGDGHVEFATDWYHQSFGAHDWGTRVGWVQWGPYWHPTEAFAVW